MVEGVILWVERGGLWDASWGGGSWGSWGGGSWDGICGGGEEGGNFVGKWGDGVGLYGVGGGEYLHVHLYGISTCLYFDTIFIYQFITILTAIIL